MPPLSVAPMMDRTDRHFRVMLRAISRRVLLYTEMVTTGAILNGDRERLLGFDPEEGPLSLQLGGDDPKALAECARLAQDLGYDEVNLNVGCPSPRVKKGNFGASLMAQPQRVADAVDAMLDAVRLPVTVKHRIGVDDLDRYDDMRRFVDVVAEAGCRRFTVHARKAWLEGLSPKENREIPPLRYDDVYRLKRERPDLEIEINGGVTDLHQAADHLRRVDAVMIGRAAYDRPFLFADADRRFFDPEAEVASRAEVLDVLFRHTERQLARGLPLSRIVRHFMHLFVGCPGARAWRRTLSEDARAAGAGVDVLRRAASAIPPGVLESRPDFAVSIH
ncbi:MAG: tRNA dihydrouridine(20/20a) synthase DusA [Acidobacteriota bacterium]